MLPNPLHPAIVHFPVVIVLVLPLVAFVTILMIRRGANARRAWSVPLACAAALALTTWAAVETGEEQSEKVERIVAEQPLDTHEERAELFLSLSGALVVVMAAGMIRGRVGQYVRAVATVGAVGLAVLGAYVGHTGGELVYRYGAANAYTQQADRATSNQSTPTTTPKAREAGGDVRRH
jgi:uncharacterized membrane protein